MRAESFEHPADGSPMVLISAGPFVMGQPDKDFLAEDHEKPQREVFLSDYWIDIYPVTNDRFARFIAAGGYEQPHWWRPEGWAWKCRQHIVEPLMWRQPGWDGADQPVAGVSWYEADAYARWASRRLPTDAEWEKAARGTDGRRYPWGDDWPTSAVANFDCQIGRTTPVGLFADGVSPYGCHDMAGNVNNWTSDWYWPAFGRFCVERPLLRDPHLNDQLRVLLGASILCDKVDRGGGFGTARECQEVLSCTRKVHWNPETRAPWNGFRTAADATS
ncbi:MAG TPA: SUMF1/EgtB/PvdO family nonheme iron enzyme [Gemmataceae bacterium]|nr:SUMF1/EgtB/PvdO family nonheme iron enzyme [Gemmataceae bacterium]